MRFYVNENCIGCGLCAGICPEVFSMTDEGVAAALEQEIDETTNQSALDAMEECPAAAIEKK